MHFAMPIFSIGKYSVGLQHAIAQRGKGGRILQLKEMEGSYCYIHIGKGRDRENDRVRNEGKFTLRLIKAIKCIPNKKEIG